MEVGPIRHLIVVLGDQLDPESAAFDDIDAKQDLIWMAESADEASQVWSVKPRIAMFFAAMRQFAQGLESCGYRLCYRRIDAPESNEPLDVALANALRRLSPAAVVYVEPGEWRLRTAMREAVRQGGCVVDQREDRHFLCSQAEFTAHTAGRKQLRMEYFYREMRRRHRVLLAADGGPEGGAWNHDASNRKSFGRKGPPAKTEPRAFAPDALTQSALRDVERHFADRPGELAAFDWPVTRSEALLALRDFIEQRLALFGDYQDAMWTDEPWLYHSRLSAALNLKLLNPREVIAAAEQAYRAGSAPLAAVEGFVRQILGWREYVRGVYWQSMPGYLERNALGATAPLPEFFWSGETDMQCLRQTLQQTLRLGYAHHIQRLMVTGLFCLLLGVDPRRVHEWYLAVYVDAVEWVELPNTLGMSQYADGGVMASKPYVASGRYIQRMSNYCSSCRYDPAQSSGERACPYTTLYWDFLLRHESALRNNQRMTMQLRNLDRLDAQARNAIETRSAALRARWAASAPLKTPLKTPLKSKFS